MPHSTKLFRRVDGYTASLYSNRTDYEHVTVHGKTVKEALQKLLKALNDL